MPKSYSEEHIRRLADALEKAGFTPDDLAAFCTTDILLAIKGVVRGEAEIMQIIAIDCDADPFTPEGWKVEEHRKHGMLQWHPEKLRLFVSPRQQNGQSISGPDLRAELAGKPVLNANVLDYLMANSYLIPKEWKGKAIFFWGTIYRSADARLNVRCLCWNGIRWDWGYFWFDRNTWDHSHPAVMLAHDNKA